MSNQHENENSKQESVEIAVKVTETKQSTSLQGTKGGVSPLVCAILLGGNRLGAGVVGLPFTIKTIGISASVTFMIFHAMMVILSMYYLVWSKMLSGRSSLSDMGNYCYGKYAHYPISILIYLAQWGYAIIFFIVFGDVSGSLFEDIFGKDTFLSSRWITHTLLAVLMSVLAFKKEIHQLKHATFVLLAIVGAFLILLFVHFMTSDPQVEEHVDLLDFTPNVATFAFLPAMMSWFGFVPAFFQAHGSLKKPTIANGMKAAIEVTLFCFFIYNVVAIIAFRLYGHDIKSNMLLNIGDESGALPIILKVLFLIIAFMHIPIIFFVAKESVLIVFFNMIKKSKRTKKEESINQNQSQKGMFT